MVLNPAGIHGHRGRRAPNATSFNDIENIVKFIKKYGEDNGLPMPAAPRSRNDIAPVFLPAYETKVHVHSVYKDSCIASDKRPVGLTLFKNTWLHTLSHIKIIKPRSDLYFHVKSIVIMYRLLRLKRKNYKQQVHIGNTLEKLKGKENFTTNV